MKYSYILKLSKFYHYKHDLFSYFINVFCSWQPDSKFPYSQVKLPPKSDPKVEFAENIEVEVYSRSNDREAYGWWKSRIKVCHRTI